MGVARRFAAGAAAVERCDEEGSGGEGVEPQSELCYDGSHAADEPTKSQSLGGNKSLDHEQQLHASNIDYESEVPLTIMTENGGEEALCKSHFYATNSETKRNLSLFRSQLESSQSCKKLKKEEAIEDNSQLLNLLIKTRGANSSRNKETFHLTTPNIEERPHLKTSSTDKSDFSESCLKERETVSSDIVSESTPNTLQERINDENHITAKSKEELLVQSTPPAASEHSRVMEQIFGLECKVTENQSSAPNFHCSSIVDISSGLLRTTERKWVIGLGCGKVNAQQQMEPVAKLSQAQCNASNDCIVRLLSGGEHRRKRDRPREVAVTKTNVSLQGNRRKRFKPRKVTILDTYTSLQGNELVQSEGKIYVGTEREHTRAKTQESSAVGNDNVILETQPCVDVDAMSVSLEENVRMIHYASDRHDSKEMDEPKIEHIMSPLETLTTSGTCIKDSDKQELTNTVVAPHNDELVETSTSKFQPDKAGGEAEEQVLLPTSVDQDADEVPKEDVRTVTDTTIKRSLSKKLDLPFVKCSPMWDFIESMEVFSTLPQEPHFRPLGQFNVELREGMAIGLMATFCSLVEKVRKLRIVDPQVNYEESLKILIHLEGYGFNVQHVRTIIEKLLSVKDYFQQLRNKKTALEGLILEKQKEKTRLDKETDMIEKAIRELEQSLAYMCEKKALIIKQREDNDSEMEKLVADADPIRESLLSAEHDFQGALAAPW